MTRSRNCAPHSEKVALLILLMCVIISDFEKWCTCAVYTFYTFQQNFFVFLYLITGKLQLYQYSVLRCHIQARNQNDE